MSTASAAEFWRRCSGGLDELFTIHSSRFAAVTKQRIRTSQFEAHRPLYSTSQFDAIADQLKLRGVDSTATSASVREKVRLQNVLKYFCCLWSELWSRNIELRYFYPFYEISYTPPFVSSPFRSVIFWISTRQPRSTVWYAFSLRLSDFC
jgi:hypothetical protein